MGLKVSHCPLRHNVTPDCVDLRMPECTQSQGRPYAGASAVPGLRLEP